MQRVTSAAVTVEGQVVGSIGPGLMVLVGVTHTDTADTAAAAARKVGGLRVLRGERSVTDGTNGTNGVRPAVLAVSQFTLYGDTRKGRRPTWAAAAPGPKAEPVFDAFVAALRADGITVETGVFGADMRVELVNDGPVTVMVEI